MKKTIFEGYNFPYKNQSLQIQTFLKILQNMFRNSVTNIRTYLGADCNKVFRLSKTSFIRGVCFYCTGSLLVGGIAPINREPVQ